MLWYYYYGIIMECYGMLLTVAVFSFVFLTLDPLRTRQWQLKTLHVVDQDIDILALTETWLRPGNIDDVEIRTLCPNGYRFLHVPRGHS